MIEIFGGFSRMKRAMLRAVCLFVGLVVVHAAAGPVALAQDNAAAGQSMDKLPPDIHPDSLSRMPRATRDQFATDDEKQAYDRLASLAATVRATKGVLGPTGTRAQIPELAEAYRNMFNLLTKDCGVDPKYFEMAVLVSTRESNNEVEWNDHEANGIKLLGPDVVEIIRNKQDPKGLEEKEALIVELGRELFHQPFGKVSSKTFADLEKNFGRQGTLGLSLTMGYYAANALLMHTYDQHTDPARKRPFPDMVVNEK
jgi:4-carboxymuconolactone decarboxylase